jgi:nitrilase
MKIGLAQYAPFWINKEKSIEKVVSIISSSAAAGLHLIVFPESFIPGYPFWLSNTDGARFESSFQKDIHAHYAAHAVQVEANDLLPIQNCCKEKKIAVYLGTVERPADRGAHSLYCSLIYIDKHGVIQSVHRKLQPTYEERLCWSPGDGHGLRVHDLQGFKVGGLNCWENWMPLPRASLYAQGENVHVAVWPGSIRNTEDITRFIAKESRSYVVSVSSYMTKADIYQIPHQLEVVRSVPDTLADGGSCLAAPNGEWVLEPQVGQEGLFTAEIDLSVVLKERQNFDPSGHYSRPDVTSLSIDRSRQQIAKFTEKES